MKRAAPLLLLLAAAAPVQHPMVLTVMARPQFGNSSYSLTPRPGFEPAPVPNLEAAAPGTANPTRSELMPTLFASKQQFRGDGFISHSTSQDEQEKNFHPVGGLTLKMPLE